MSKMALPEALNKKPVDGPSILCCFFGKSQPTGRLRATTRNLFRKEGNRVNTVRHALLQVVYKKFHHKRIP